MRVGVIGCGTIAYWAHLRTLRSLAGATLVAAADPDPAARERAARLAGVPVHESASALLGRADVDAVVVSAPTAHHAELAVAAAEAGKHLYLEKPLATNAADACRAADAIRRAGIVAAIGFNFRHHPAHQRARALLAEGHIGAVRAVQTVFCEPTPIERMPPWKRRRDSGGGALLDLASHHVDLLRWLLADEVESVQARIEAAHSEGDTAALDLRMRGGVDVQSYVSFCAGPVDCFELVGERGSLRVDRHSLMPRLRKARGSRYGLRSHRSMPDASTAAAWIRRVVRPSYDPSYRRALEAFVGQVQGRSTQVATIDDGERSLAVVLAAEESARCQRVVRMP